MNFRFYLSFLFFFAIHHSHSKSKDSSSSWCCIHTAVSCSDTWDLLNKRRGWGTPNFKVILALSPLNVFSHFLYHIGLEEKFRKILGRKSVIIAKRITTLEDKCSSLLIPGIKNLYAEIGYHKESANLGASFSWVQKCSAEGSKGLAYFLWCLIHCPLWFLNFFVISNTVETSEFLIT